MKGHLYGVGTGPDRRPDLPPLVDDPLTREVVPVLGAAPLHPVGR